MADIYDTFDKTLYKTGNPVTQPSGNILTDISGLPSDMIGSGYSAGNNEMVEGNLQSGSFLTGVRGWQIDANGNVEFNDGIFRGDIIIGGTIRTVDTVEEIQPAINAVAAGGGGSIYIAPGTYFPTGHIDIPSNVYLIGATRSGTIIDFNGQPYSVRSIGSVGTHNINIFLSNITIQNSSVQGVYFQYLDVSAIDGVDVFGNGTGIEMDNTDGVGLIGNGIVSDGNGTNIKITNSESFSIYFSFVSASTSGHGLEMSDCNSATIFDIGFVDNTLDGINLTNCTNIAFISFNSNNNGSNGVECVSGCEDLQFSSGELSDNGSDGYKLTATSDRNTIVALSITNNGGYGINIAAASCNDNIINVPSFSGNASGEINDQGTDTIILPPDVTSIEASFTAESDLTIGQPVGVSNLANGYVAKAAITVPSPAHGITSPALTGAPACWCPIGGDKFAYMQYTTASSDTLITQVCSINRSTQAVTLGTAATAATNFTPNSGNSIAMCKLDTDKFIIFYLLDGSNTIIKYRVATVSGTTISYGTEATFFTAASSVANSQSWGADFISTDKGVFYAKASTTADSRIIAFTTSGTVATAGTAIAPGAGTQLNSVSYIKKIAADKFVLGQLNSGGASLYLQVGTISGTTITLGTELQVTPTANSTRRNAFQIVSPADDVFVVTMPASTTTQDVLACTVATRTITAGSILTTGALVATSSPAGIYADSSSVLYLIYQGDSSTGEKAYKVTLSGTTLSNSGKFMADSSMPNADGVIAMDNGYFVFTTQLSSNIDIWYRGLANGFVGTAQTTVSRGSPVSVLLRGIDSSQTGLSAGSTYQVVNGTLNLINNQAIVDDNAEQYLVKAISSTQFII